MKFWGIRLASIAAGVGGAFLLQTLAQPKTLIEPRLLTLVCLYVTLAVSLNLINGITGQFSIGHAGFFAVGAYTASILSKTMATTASGMPPIAWIATMSVAGAIASAVAGLVVGLPSLRLRGDYLAIVTLGFGEIIRLALSAQDNPMIGGSYGTNVEPRLQSVFLAALLAIICVAVCRNILQTAHGLPFLAIREDEVASNAMGVNTTQYKVIAFVLGSAFAGAAGAIFAHTEGFISPLSFNMDLSFLILTMVVLGGNGSVTGSVISAVLLFYLPEVLRGGQGESRAVPATAFIGFLAFTVVLTMWAHRLQHKNVESKQKRTIEWLQGLGLAGVLGTVLALATQSMPGPAGSSYEVTRLRMVLFAIILIIMMLLRPEGIFGHREIGWGTFFKPKERSA